jgi:hypothetical protein
MEMPEEALATIYVESAAHDHWIVCSEYPGELLGRFENKDMAIDAARKIARDRSAQMVVRRDENEIEFAEDYASVER